MRRNSALALLLVLLAGGDLSAQVLDDALVPAGRVRLQMFPVYTRWESRFGRDAAVSAREQLGEDLTSSSASSLFPGTASLTAAIDEMTGAGGFSPVLGETLGRVTKDVTRVEFGGYLGVFDWLTIGAVLPWTRTRSNVDAHFTPDASPNLGLSPAMTDAAQVASFLQATGSASTAALADAAQVCGASPGSAACVSAQALADRTSSFDGAARTAYASSPLFPFAGSSTATALDAATSQLDADLTAAGLPGIGMPMVFASDSVTADNFPLLPATAGSGIETSALGSIRGPWQAGDVELSATVRLLEGASRDSLGAPKGFSYQLIGSVLGRLPTGTVDSPDVLLDVGTGDGQTDLEGRLMGAATLGRRFEIRAGARYGIQMSRTLVRRVVAPEVVLAPVSTRQLVEWKPGAYFALEVAPSWRFSDVLMIGAEYRAFRKYRDSYELAGSSVGAAVDPAVLEVESGITLHEVGGVIRYDTLARWLARGDTDLLQLHMRLSRAVAGGGGQTPVMTRVEFGVRLFRRFWGEP